MPSIVTQLSNLVSSIIGSIVAVFQTLINTILGVIGSLFSAVGTMVSGLAHTFEGLTKFLLSNILVIGAVVGALFLYGVYQQRQGGAPITAKKTN